MSAFPERHSQSGSPAPTPSGVVTFAFTDIEGSTERWDRDPVAMAAALRRHDELMRAAIDAHDGYVFKTIGDAFCAAFTRPSDAVAAIVAAQRAFAAADFAAVGGLRFRAALHTGTADERDGDYYGPTVNRVARLLAIAHGGQAILSGATHEFVAGALNADVRLRDLGEHRLKDLTRPERVYGVIVPDLPADFPPLRSLRATANNLPLQSTALVGRESVVAEIIALMGTHRLVTLVGSGGVGKTRASLEAAANVLDRRRNGVWLVELAPLASGEYLASAAAVALGVKLPGTGDPLTHLVRALSEHDALVIFDNCEHLVDAAATAIAALLAGCPRVSVLASSRQSLGLTGERVYRVPSLSLPPAGAPDGLSAQQALQGGAVELFAERARAVDDRFTLSDETAPIVADICRRLDGIPLAIELAAARVRLLGPRQLNARLSERFRILTGGNRDRLPRQQTLRALVDWSYDLLDERERTLFRRLGIFVGSFTLAAAVAVAGSAELDEFDVIDLLGSLVDKSLVHAEPDGDAQRFRLLESTRAYAREKLEAAGELPAAALLHLRDLSARFGARWRSYMESGNPASIDTLLAVELDEVRAALDFALNAGFAIDGVMLLAQIEKRWSTLGLLAELAARCTQFMAVLPEDADVPRAQLLCSVAVYAATTGQIGRALSAAGEALAHARRGGDPEVLAEALRWYGDGKTMIGQFDAAEAALLEAAALPISRTRAVHLVYPRAHLAQKRGDLLLASELFALELQRHREARDASMIMGTLINLAEIEHARGHTTRALDYAREALAPSRALAERMRLALLLSNMAGYAVAVADCDGCLAFAAEAIREIAALDPESPFVGVALEHAALAYAMQGDVPRAATIAGYAAPLLAKHGLERGFTERTTYERLTALFRDGLEPTVLAGYEKRGAELSAREAIALALAGRAP